MCFFWESPLVLFISFTIPFLGNPRRVTQSSLLRPPQIVGAADAGRVFALVFGGGIDG